MDLDAVIRRVPDFPKPGIMFYDVTSIFTNPAALAYVVDEMAELYPAKAIDGVIAIESRGFILGAPYAIRAGVPLVLARKKGKLPGRTVEESYELEYGRATLEIHVADLTPGKRWLIVDDLIATGGTIEAVGKMVKRREGEVAGVFAIVGLPFLNYAAKIGEYAPKTLIDFEGE
ncbi:MAG: adenine phosphoribosyltransferase [Chitinivibrionales bacterium]|nr:adenine phosphoribosyltransferase [Chitinivibrionales bacterium]MBD3355811.1 adenine phosphoribosyltransferase [Chitinivibrionales bacterium]